MSCNVEKSTTVSVILEQQKKKKKKKLPANEKKRIEIKLFVYIKVLNLRCLYS